MLVLFIYVIKVQLNRIEVDLFSTDTKRAKKKKKQ